MLFSLLMAEMSARDWAAQLYAARRDCRAIAPISEQEPGLTPTDAYGIQRQFVDLLLAEGGSVVGYKLGLTSKAMQKMVGVDQPDYGPVLSTMVRDDGAQLDLSEFLQPRIEAEIALILDSPLRGPGVSSVQAALAVGGAVAALELIDSRITDWRITLVDTIADLASSAAVVLGSNVVSPDGWDARYLGMVIRRNGQVEATGAGAAALDNPVRAVAWLANALAEFGVTLEAGHVVMTGSLHRAFPIESGDRIRADFDRLGLVACQFL